MVPAALIVDANKQVKSAIRIRIHSHKRGADVTGRHRIGSDSKAECQVTAGRTPEPAVAVSHVQWRMSGVADNVRFAAAGLLVGGRIGEIIIAVKNRHSLCRGRVRIDLAKRCGSAKECRTGDDAESAYREAFPAKLFHVMLHDTLLSTDCDKWSTQKVMTVFGPQMEHVQHLPEARGLSNGHG